jgi:hypothetical protein
MDLLMEGMDGLLLGIPSATRLIKCDIRVECVYVGY